MIIRYVSSTEKTITWGWDPVPGARGFRYTLPDGRRSHTWNGAITSARFTKMNGVYLIEPIMIHETGEASYPLSVPPPIIGMPERPITELFRASGLRIRVVNTPTDLISAWRTALPGDRIVAPIAFPSGSQLDLPPIRIASPGLEVDFRGATFPGNGPRLLNACRVKLTSGVRFYGGEMANPTGGGLRIESSDIAWWGLTVDGVAATCIGVYGLDAEANVDLDATVSRNGGDPTQDPHVEKGTGQHGLYIGAGGYKTKGRYAITAHDLPAGAAVQIGYNSDVDVWIDARRLTKVANIQVAGNALQPWGNNVTVRAHYLYAEDVARCVEADALGADANILVEYARTKDYRLLPYVLHPGIQYIDADVEVT